MTDIVFKNFKLLDPEVGTLESGQQVRVNGNTIAEVSPSVDHSPDAEIIDLGDRTLMPGLIDCHNHISREILAGPPSMLPSLSAARTSSVLHDMLMRGFTTLRDAAGADLGHKEAVEKGYFLGPRLFVAGKSISQTGGHGDHRVRADQSEPCACVHLGPGIGRVADGISEVRKAVRDEIRLGADQIKMMASGGIASASDPIDQLQYSTEEMEAIVDEAARSNTYVMAHAYPDAAIRRCVEAGVRTIEHGNMLGPETAKLMAEKGAYLVPTLVAFRCIQRYGPETGYNDEQMEKNEKVLAAGTQALLVAKEAGVKVAFGTDIAFWHEHQCEEFLIRGEVLEPIDIIRSATIIGAEVVRMVGRLGVVKPDAFADLIVVDGNPLDDLGLFQDQGAHIPVIMANGKLVKNALIG